MDIKFNYHDKIPNASFNQSKLTIFRNGKQFFVPNDSVYTF